ncbi:MAG: N-acetylmuramic acid 6-phosphate etherase [Nitrospirae bacterium]|nr:N-acetylmuramic acid 6-phosphate etherase [Nitrospirota bacterium]
MTTFYIYFSDCSYGIIKIVGMDITESINPRSKFLDTISIGKAIELFIDEEVKGLKGILKEKSSIEKIITAVAETIKNGGRIFYVGAGTSGRIGVIDASEIPPTFSISHNKIQAIIAGGKKAVFSSIEKAEDDVKSAIKAIRGKNIGDKDMVIGISASGKTPFVLSALKEAKRKKAETWLITFNKIQMPSFVNGLVNILVGPEIIAGSTRLKSGTATKVILNMISTLSMVKLGKVYQNLMVDVKPVNKKLWKRARNIIIQVTGVKEEEAEGILKRARGNVKMAILMKVKGVGYSEARRLLMRYDGMLREALR